ncbi:MAG: MFS transporter [Burkholderiaceae bacterium]
MNRNLLLLTLCQGLFFTNNVTFVAVNGLVGLAIAPYGWMATLPLTAYVTGAAVASQLVARHQRAYGRKRCFVAGLMVAILSAGVCALAAMTRNFALLLAGTLVAGYYSANAALYRFAAIELADAAHKEKAISWVLAGGIMGGVIGPNLASATRELLPVAFAGAYVALMVVALVSLLLMTRIAFPPLPGGAGAAQTGRGVRELARQPTFVVAIAGAALGYGVMNLLMAATPIAMQQCSHPFSAVALVLETHVLAMFVPSFFTGHLIRRFGVLRIMGCGVALNLACVVFALSGQEVMHFVGALVMLGLGWNFLYIGGTTLFTESYRPEERTQAQATMDTTVAATMALTSFSSGALVTTGGWQWMNIGSLLPLLGAAVAIAWLARVRSRTQNALSA